MKKYFVAIIAIVLACVTLTMSACFFPESNNMYEEQIIAVESSDFKATSMNSEPVAASTSISKLVVEDSMTDGNYNYYLINVGYVKNMYISTVAMIHYTGVPMTFSKSYKNSSSYMTSMTKCVEESITVKESDSHTATISASWEKQFKETNTFKVEGSYSYQKNYGSEETNKESRSSTIESATAYEESIKINGSFGKNEIEGFYRYAIYGTCDIYFNIKTSKDNSELLFWETSAVAREDKYYIRAEYSEDGEFDNTPIDTIEISEDYYKNLEKPTKSTAKLSFSKTIRERSTKIYLRNNNVIDTVEFTFDGITYNQLVSQGKTKVDIIVSVEIQEIRTSKDLYNGVSIEDKAGESLKKWEYSRHQGDWGTYDIEIDNVDISKIYIGDNTYKMRVRYYCRDNHYQDWNLGKVKVTVTAHK